MGEVTEFDIGFIDSIDCHMAMISLNGDIIIPAYQTSTVTIDPRSRLRLITRLCVTQRRDHNATRARHPPAPFARRSSQGRCRSRDKITPHMDRTMPPVVGRGLVEREIPSGGARAKLSQ